MATGRHVRRRRRGVIIAVVAALVCTSLLGVGGAAYAAYRYEYSHADRILPGVTIAGVDVGGMTGTEAAAAVREAADVVLGRRLTITAGEHRWTVTAAALGRRASVQEAVRQALDAGEGLSTLDRFWHRFRDEAVGVSIPLSYSTTGSAIDALVATIAEEVYVPARRAAIGITEDRDDLTFTKARPGEKLAVANAGSRISDALERGTTVVHLRTVAVEPKVTAATLGRSIVVRLDENRLYLYEGFEAKRSWDVATAKPGYETPTGVWTIWDKRENPTWYNPALDTWGAGLPAVIPGGPGNPMGTRAIYIDAPGLIRIHGTTDPSSIGRYASHGCIRMHNEEIEALFPLVDVGRRVIIVGARPADAGYWSVPPASDI
jgi:lipoprotein-anchoring transpeptidase ErfK/SrfK